MFSKNIMKLIILETVGVKVKDQEPIKISALLLIRYVNTGNYLI